MSFKEIPQISALGKQKDKKRLKNKTNKHGYQRIFYEISTCVCVCVCVLARARINKRVIPLFSRKKTERQREREGERETDRKTDTNKYTCKHTHTQKHTQTHTH